MNKSDKLKILQICSKPPLPAKDGGCIAMNNVTQGLLKLGHEVRILTISTHKHPLEKNLLPKEYIEKTKINGTFVDTKVNIVDAFSNLVTQDSYNISRFFSPDFDKLLFDTLKREKFDIIHLESLFVTPYIATIKRNSKAKIVFRSHNLEYQIWERMADSTINKAKRAYLKVLAKQLKRYELGVFPNIDGIVSISNVDTKKYQDLGYKNPILTMQLGVNFENYPETSWKGNELSLFHIGSMDWKPNIEGINWFLEKIWPKLNREFPDLKLMLAGRGMPESLLKGSHPNVIVIGEVESASDFMAEHAIMVVPILSGGGIRVKIIEGMALGKTILSTSVGAEGIEYTDGENIFIADSPEDYIKSIHQLLNNKELITTIGKNARLLAKKKYSIKALSNSLIDFYYSILG